MEYYNLIHKYNHHNNIMWLSETEAKKMLSRRDVPNLMYTVQLVETVGDKVNIMDEMDPSDVWDGFYFQCKKSI